MDNVPYEEWVNFVIDILKDHGISDGLVLDLGCGTGEATRLLARHGYDMIGVDSSEDMLMIANEKRLAAVQGDYENSCDADLTDADSKDKDSSDKDSCGKDSCDKDSSDKDSYDKDSCDKDSYDKDSRDYTSSDLDSPRNENNGYINDRMGIESTNFESDILYLCQDMREFELYGTVRAIVSMCDCMNYILEPDELLTVFELAHNYLDWDGLFIFDMNTPFKYAELLADNTFAENREDCSFIWENEYDTDTKINTYDLTLFVQNEMGDFTRYEEYHEQRCFEQDEVCELLVQAGFVIEKVCEAYTGAPLSAESDRALYVARKIKL